MHDVLHTDDYNIALQLVQRYKKKLVGAERDLLIK